MRRVVIPILAILVGLLVVFGMAYHAQQNTSESAQQNPQTEARPSEAEAPQQPEASASAPGTSPEDTEQAPATQTADEQGTSAPAPAPEAPEQTEADYEPIEGLHAVGAEQPEITTLGSADPDSGYKLSAEVVPYGAGLDEIYLAEYKQSVRSDEPYRLSRHLELDRPGRETPYIAYPFAARRIQVNDGDPIDLHTVTWQHEETAQAGEGGAASSAVSYSLELADADDQPIVRLERTFGLSRDSYGLELEQRVVNLTGQPLKIEWHQHLQGDLPQDKGGYLGDRRTFFTGHRNLNYSRQHIAGSEYYIARTTLLEPSATVWPNPNLEDGQNELIWLAAANRYFALVTYPGPADRVAQRAELPPLTSTFADIGIQRIPPEVPDAQRALLLTASTESFELPAEESQSLDHSIYAGPRKGEVVAQEPWSTLGLGNLLVYELGCTWCTFQVLSEFLLWFLKLIEGQILTIGGMPIGVFDWGVSIIILVAVVRVLLHPLTRRAQINMMKMSKKMQQLQPEVEKLKKKYQDDQQKLNQEMMKLYREKGVNPAGMLGCLPMFLQMPIWVALYAMLYFAIELRHEPAFYGVFQQLGEMAGVYWPFLADLSRADQFLPLPVDVPIPLPFVENAINAVNLLPIMMGVVMYLQQKFTMPPATTEQAAQQQKIMKYMMPLILPIALYSAPSGLTLYILASTGAGVVDSYLVRKHVREQEEAGTLFEKKQPKPGSLRDRMQKTLEEKQRQIMEQQQQQKGGGSGGGAKGGGGSEKKQVKSKKRK